MTRRTNLEGSIDQQASGKFRARFSLGDGRVTKTFATRRDAVAWLRHMAEQKNQGLTYAAARVSLGEYLSTWLASAQATIRPNSFKAYRTGVRRILAHPIAARLITDLRADDVQAFYDGLLGAGVNPPSIKKCHEVLHKALGRAVRTGMIYQNPAELAEPPRAPKPEMKFWTDAEANQFLVAARTDRFYALFYLALTTGARQMELLGLQWTDLDWLKGTLRFQRQLNRTGKDFAEIKTRSGNRTIRLGAGSLQVLRDHYERQQLERRFAGNRWQERGLIFASQVGTPIDRNNMLDRHFYPLMKAAGVKRIRFHDLRHTAAALMLSAGQPVFLVSKYLGHANPSITMNIYGHLIPGATDELGQLMDNLVSPLVLDDQKNWSQIGHEKTGEIEKNVKVGEKQQKRP